MVIGAGERSDPPCVGCGRTLRQVRGHAFYTCETPACGGNVTRFDRSASEKAPAPTAKHPAATVPATQEPEAAVDAEVGMGDE